MHSDDRKASKEYHVNDSSASTGNFKTVKEVYHIDKVHEGSQIYNDSEFRDDLSQQEFDFPLYSTSWICHTECSSVFRQPDALARVYVTFAGAPG